MLSVQDHPEGYPRLAKFLTGDDSFMMFRRFRFVFARVLLNKQDEIMELERHLRYCDDADQGHLNGQKCLRSRKFDLNRDETLKLEGFKSRQNILKTLETSLVTYSTLLEKSRVLEALENPEVGDLQDLQCFVQTRDGVLFDPERSFLWQSTDRAGVCATLRPFRQTG